MSAVFLQGVFQSASEISNRSVLVDSTDCFADPVRNIRATYVLEEGIRPVAEASALHFSLVPPLAVRYLLHIFSPHRVSYVTCEVDCQSRMLTGVVDGTT